MAVTAQLPAPDPAALLTGVQDALTAVLATDLLDHPAQVALDVLDQAETLRRQLEALTARALTAVEADGRWALDGARSMAAWYRNRSGRHHSAAARKVRQARALRDHLPATATALATGTISVDHAAALVRHTTDTPARQALLRHHDLGEDFLLGHATTMDAHGFTLALRHWALRADPDAADRAYRADADREEFYLAETTDGYVPGGWLSKTTGTALLTALDARVGTPAATDTRTPNQRRAGALGSLAHLTLDAGILKPFARTRPHLCVTVPFTTLALLARTTRTPHHPTCPATNPRPTGPGAAFGPTGPGAAFGPTGPGAAFGPTGPGAAFDLTGPAAVATDAVTTDAAGPVTTDAAAAGCTCGHPEAVISADYDLAAMAAADPATLADGTPLPPALLARLACSSGIHRVVFGPDSQPLDVGREERLYTAAQTRAIIARDRHCQYPDCSAPPGEGEIHHSLWWYAQHGPTDLRTGILLCWHHHDHVHNRHITIERHTDRWTFHRRDGTLLGTTTFRTN
ncbi:DUF222 domain-containing protein [Georgenia muralis]|uniref:Uncharacterized protein DUF222 n=1 Tax=Georgenia muralis TaxID=154117 RepID=A0A3N4YYA8_9MICO|nr:DUF222 domain-containing protein [Georgenia muralis]RPF26139.1 uncharacterized protein DUF222 [Georgenia muralis]